MSKYEDMLLYRQTGLRPDDYNHLFVQPTDDPYKAYLVEELMDDYTDKWQVSPHGFSFIVIDTMKCIVVPVENHFTYVIRSTDDTTFRQTSELLFPTFEDAKKQGLFLLLRICRFLAENDISNLEL